MKTIFTISNVGIIALLLLECAMSTKTVNKAPKVGITVRSEGHLSSPVPPSRKRLLFTSVHSSLHSI